MITCPDCSEKLDIRVQREAKVAVVMCHCGRKLAVFPGRSTMLFPWRWPKVVMCGYERQT